MEVVVVALSALGLVAAAVAAWGAVVTVQMTRQAQFDERLRRVFEALAAVRRALDEIKARPGERSQERFRDAQLDLDRAYTTPPYVETGAGSILQALIDPTAIEDLDEAKRLAKRARWILALDPVMIGEERWSVRWAEAIFGLRRLTRRRSLD